MKMNFKMTENKSDFSLWYWALLLLVFIPYLGWSQTFYELPKPNNYVKGIPRVELTVVNEIEPDFDEDNFYVLPFLLEVNKAGTIFLYDMKLGKMLIFNSQYKFVTEALSIGRGPFETVSAKNINIYAAADGTVYIHDGLGDRLMQFSATGKPLMEKKLGRGSITFKPFRPVVDKDGFLYTFSIRKGLVDCYDKNLKFVRTYLDRALNDRFIFYRPKYDGYYPKRRNKKEEKKPKPWLAPSWFRNYYDITRDGQLFIFNHRSATAYFFNKEKLVRKFEVLIDRVLPKFKEDTLKKLKELKGKKEVSKIPVEGRVYTSVFLDKDADFIYFQGRATDKECSLYQVDFTGKLVRIYSFGGKPVRFLAKCNSLFYGQTGEEFQPIILKIK